MAFTSISLAQSDSSMDAGLHITHKSNCGENVNQSEEETNHLLDNFQQVVNRNHQYNWIEKTFKKKICTTFIKSSTNENICGCGRHFVDHKIQTTLIDNPENISWNPNIHTKEINTNAYGQIKFHCKRKIATAKYVRLSVNTQPKDIMKLLTEEWKLEYPSIIISITGGRRDLKINDKVKQSFSESLSKISDSTNVWFITGGINTGIMKHVGETVRSSQQKFEAFLEKRKIVCIGMAAWGFVLDRKNLINQGNSISYTLQKTNVDEIHGGYLDQHHTHFLLVDDGILNNYGGDVILRSRLEKHIMGFKSKCGGIDCIPGVQLVVEGAFYTIRTVLYSISENPPMPVVVMKGTGGAADLLAFAVSMRYAGGQFFKETQVQESKKLMTQIQKCFPGKNLNDYLKIFNEIMKCMKYKEYITVYDVDDKSISLDVAILTALLNVASKCCSTFSILNLSMIWRQIDFARNQIFVEGKKHDNLHESMFYALAHNHPDFVDLILENGFNMHKFLDVNKLQMLYNIRRGKEKDMLTVLFHKISKENDISIQDVSFVLQKLIGRKINSCSIHVGNKAENSDSTDGTLFTHPFNELFLWSVLSNMPDMAISIWKYGEEGLAKGLIGLKLFKELSTLAKQRHLFDDIVEDLDESARKFGDLSVNLLQECYISNSILAAQLIKYSSGYFGETSCLTLAITSRHLDFVAHSSCQGLLTAKWSSPLHVDSACSYWIILCFIFPPLILTTPLHIENEELYEKMRELELSSDGENEIDTVRRNFTFAEKYFKFFAAPVTKYWSNFCVYLMFLVLFVITVTRKLENDPCLVEWFLFVVALVFSIEEIRQVCYSKGNTFCDHVKDYLLKSWNIWDIIAVTLFFIGFGLRFDSEQLVESRVVYAIDIMIWILRISEYLTIFEQIGPYIVMIQKMAVDTAYFMFILIIFLVSYAVTRYVLLYPNDNRSMRLLGETVMVSYFQIYGELFLDYPSNNNNETIFSTENQFEHTEPIVVIIMAVYLFVANILLLNLLIAIFNNTYEKVQSNSRKIWKFQRYGLLHEYIKPIINPHLIIFDYTFRCLKYCSDYFCLSKTCHFKRKKGKKKSKYNLHNLFFFEAHCVETLLQKGGVSSYKSLDEETSVKAEYMNKMNCIAMETKSLHKEIENLKCLVNKLQFKNKKENSSIRKKDFRTIPDEEYSGILEARVASKIGVSMDDLTARGNQYNKWDSSNIKEDVHTLSRSPIYPCTNVYRQPIADEFISWKVEMENYNPPEYTSPMVLACPDWADSNQFGSTYNIYDGDVDRRSNIGTYDVINGLPRNPFGRTGITGRGLLGRYGPNHKFEAIITRALSYEHQQNRLPTAQIQFLLMDGNSLLHEFNGKDEFPERLSSIFDLKVLNDLDLTESQRGRFTTKLKGIMDNKTVVYSGYVDDPMNTDNAWRESTVVHFHDLNGDIFNTFLLAESNKLKTWRWVGANVMQSSASKHENNVMKHVMRYLNEKT